LIKNKYYHKFIEIFSGYSSIVEVKNPPTCFYYSNNIFITPHINNQVKITLHSEINSVNNNYYVNKDNINYEKLSEKIQNNSEIQRLGFISIKNIWRGSRAMTYDIIPFIEEIDNNVYLFTGGGYMGTHMAYNFSRWLVELIDNKEFTNLPIFNNKVFNPKLERLELIRKKYYLFISLFILLIIIIVCY
jgi:glycine/D-amino acid oxidase-like deaminating enzyme